MVNKYSLIMREFQNGTKGFNTENILSFKLLPYSFMVNIFARKNSNP